MWVRINDQKVFIAVMIALLTLTWIALWVWSVSPYARYLDHDQLRSAARQDTDWLTWLCGGETPGNQLSGAALLFTFIGGWTLMTSAMMLPTSLPLLALFYRMICCRPDRFRLVSLLIAGYLGVWALFGGVAHIGDSLVHAVVEQSSWLRDNAWIIGAATLTVAGVYQFTPLKRACLDKCRSPLSFIAEHWRGKREWAQSFWLGAHHGMFCVGCCWSLMLLMFLVSIGNIAWMLGLGAVMAAEKNLPWGRKLSTPLGLVLLAGGMMLIATAGFSA